MSETGALVTNDTTTPFVTLDGAAAVLTAAGSGIGRAVAHALARRGSRVIVSDIDGDRADAVAAEVRADGGNAIALGCDVTSMDDLEHMRDVCIEAFGRVDVIMNNVGVLAVGPPELIRHQPHGHRAQQHCVLARTGSIGCRTPPPSMQSSE